MTLFRYPARQVDLGIPPVHSLRHTASLLYRRDAAPVLVVNAYAHASDPAQRRLFLRTLLDAACSTGRQFIILGDFNQVADDPPFADFAAHGLLYPADDDFPLAPASTRPGGPRRIDYALLHRALFATAR